MFSTIRFSQPPFAAPHLRTAGVGNFKVHSGTWVKIGELWVAWATCHVRTRSKAPGRWTDDSVDCLDCLSAAHRHEASTAPEFSVRQAKAWLKIYNEGGRLCKEMAKDLPWDWDWDRVARNAHPGEFRLVDDLERAVIDMVQLGRDEDLLPAKWFVPQTYKEIGHILHSIYGPAGSRS